MTEKRTQQAKPAPRNGVRRRGFLASVAAAAAALALPGRRRAAPKTPRRRPPRWIGHD